MTRPYILSKGAAADLRDITRYTVTNWGESQCRSHIAELEKAAEAVARGEGVFKDMGWLHPACAWYPAGSTTSSACPRRAHRPSSWPCCMSAWT